MIIDFNAHYGRDSILGGCRGAEELVALERAAGIDLAVASDIGTAFTGTRISQEPAPDGLIPFASLSPDTDLRLIPCVKGLRIYPTYHIWDFGGAEGEGLVSYARQLKLIVQVFLRLQDPRTLPMVLDTGEAIKQLLYLVTEFEYARFVVSGATYAEASADPALFGRSNVWTDISHLQHPINSLPKLLELIDSSRVLFGSGAPVLYPYANIFRVINSPISDEAREQILCLNARELIGDAR